MTEAEFERRLYHLRLGNTPGFLVRSAEGGWEFSMHSPPLGSGAYLERLSNGVIRRWHNTTTGDMSYIDL
jgi:hypothetical protein